MKEIRQKNLVSKNKEGEGGIGRSLSFRQFTELQLAIPEDKGRQADFGEEAPRRGEGWTDKGRRDRGKGRTEGEGGRLSSSIFRLYDLTNGSVGEEEGGHEEEKKRSSWGRLQGGSI